MEVPKEETHLKYRPNPILKNAIYTKDVCNLLLNRFSVQDKEQAEKGPDPSL